jgi:hypothetical protein
MAKHQRSIPSRALLAVCVAITLSGCGLIQNQGPGVITPRRGASVLLKPDPSANPALSVATYYTRSLSECARFKEGVISATTGVNAGADYTALLLSAISSVVSPIATVHLLTAGAAAASGAKATYAADVTADNTVNLTIALDRIYFQPMAEFARTSLSAPVTADTAPSLLMQLVSLQQQCSLDEARAYISQNLTQGVPVAPNGRRLAITPR